MKVSVRKRAEMMGTHKRKPVEGSVTPRTSPGEIFFINKIVEKYRWKNY